METLREAYEVFPTSSSLSSSFLSSSSIFPCPHPMPCWSYPSPPLPPFLLFPLPSSPPPLLTAYVVYSFFRLLLEFMGPPDIALAKVVRDGFGDGK
eukprot:753324-Hanusia_phi.AAC.2